jgi:hypothetical protein
MGVPWIIGGEGGDSISNQLGDPIGEWAMADRGTRRGGWLIRDRRCGVGGL